MELDLNNPEQKNYIQDVLRQGANTEFWQVLKQRAEYNIKSLQGALEADRSNLIAEEYKIQTQVIINEKKVWTIIKDLPELLANELDTPEFFGQNREEEVYEEPKEVD